MKRVDHVLTEQVFGIGIHPAHRRRPPQPRLLKWANGKHSIAELFTGEDGNIWFEPVEHTWSADGTGLDRR